MEAMRAHFEREAGLDSPWTSYNASLGRPLLNSEKFLSPKKSAPPEVPDEPRHSKLDPSESPDPTPSLPGVMPRR
jgi:hypothetical protein